MSESQSACSEFCEDLSAWLDGELTPARREAVAAHLEACDACHAELDALSAVDAGLRSLPTSAPSPALRRAVLDRAGREAPPSASRRAPERRSARRLAAGLAVAALVALALLLSRPGSTPEEPPRLVSDPADTGERRLAEIAPARSPEAAETLREDSAAVPDELLLAMELDTLDELEMLAQLDVLEAWLALDDRGGVR